MADTMTAASQLVTLFTLVLLFGFDLYCPREISSVPRTGSPATSHAGPRR
jgi:hypothetical protein